MEQADITSAPSRNLLFASGAFSACGRTTVNALALEESNRESDAQRVTIRGKERNVAVPVWAKVPTEDSRQHSPFASTLRRRETCAVYIKRFAMRIEREWNGAFSGEMRSLMLNKHALMRGLSIPPKLEDGVLLTINDPISESN